MQASLLLTASPQAMVQHTTYDEMTKARSAQFAAHQAEMTRQLMLSKQLNDVAFASSAIKSAGRLNALA